MATFYYTGFRLIQTGAFGGRPQHITCKAQRFIITGENNWFLNFFKTETLTNDMISLHWYKCWKEPTSIFFMVYTFSTRAERSEWKTLERCSLYPHQNQLFYTCTYTRHITQVRWQSILIKSMYHSLLNSTRIYFIHWGTQSYTLLCFVKYFLMMKKKCQQCTKKINRLYI